MTYLELLEKFEKEVLGGKIVAKRHDAREDFAMWLDKKAAEQRVQADETIMCPCPYCLGKRCEKCDENGNLHIPSRR